MTFSQLLDFSFGWFKKPLIQLYSGSQTFDTICLNDPENINPSRDGVDGSTIPVLPQKTWTEMHDEFYAEPPKNPGKILLLYSPDTKQFKELQVSSTIT